ncbi:protein of unknown function DUF322 [Desulfofarcimen acetoxidans DSM 771]|uniref:Asp23/Gls24 family envelope stress response protein n=1 Tax=Desulfofarcimen acetoxidans (strain ATCC 49208 / DSM 771 / KCTC 5769 / VKM B-1644 / 5575) TaxID=485916 RepID=C8W0Z8_DESAS|nr:Asp23/Gls24 family envelope stress response protein [Desulfofarcimen acetoxidans]ACV63394.1 protein of unknown function DUF322 [Desulfofarcimen acetoxidans DSM 771]
MTAGYQVSQPVESKMGSIKISGDVVRVIAGKALEDISGVVGINSSSNPRQSDFKSLTQGIKAELSENLVAITLQVQVEYGYNIPDVAFHIQVAVKRRVEEITGLAVTAVNITVEGVRET